MGILHSSWPGQPDQQRDEQPTKTSVAVEEGVDGFELGLYGRQPHQPIGRVGVQ